MDHEVSVGKSVATSQLASPLIPSVPPVLRLELAEPIPVIIKRARVVFAACMFACAAKVIERVCKYDSDQFYEGSPKLDKVLVAIVGLAVLSQVFLHIRNRG